MTFTFWYLSLACCDINLLVFSISLFLVARRLVLQYSSLDSSVTFPERFNSEKNSAVNFVSQSCVLRAGLLEIVSNTVLGLYCGKKRELAKQLFRGQPLLWQDALEYHAIISRGPYSSQAFPVWQTLETLPISCCSFRP